MHRGRLSKIILADYRYGRGSEEGRVTATYVQDTRSILERNKEERESQEARSRIRDLDMGFKFASIPKIEWLKIQKMGIDQDPVAIMKYVEINQHLKTTKKRLI
jgi:hypothetical protein